MMTTLGRAMGASPSLSVHRCPDHAEKTCSWDDPARSDVTFGGYRNQPNVLSPAAGPARVHLGVSQHELTGDPEMRKIKTGMVIVAGALLLSGCHGGSRPDSAPAPVPPSASASDPATQPAVRPAAAATIDGTLYYSDGDRLYSLAGVNRTVVLKGSGVNSVEVSPDGKHLAYVLGNGDLMLANADGTQARRLRPGMVTAGFGPTWSSDSSRVVVARTVGEQTWQAGTVRLAGDRFAALPAAIQGQIHYRLTGDGRRYFYSDGQCAIFSASVDGTAIKKVPVLGLTDTATNPRRLRACDIVSLNADGSRMTVDLHVGNQTDGDIGGSQAANSVVDTATGTVLRLPVPGTVRQVLYLHDGTLLVRSGSAAKPVLTLLSASLEVLATKAEPASVKSLVLLDYTP
jgi:TolB protein